MRLPQFQYKKSWSALGGLFSFRTALLFAAVGFLASPAYSQEHSSNTDSVAALKAELEAIKGQLPSQSHTMADVAYHFRNLYFAADKKNWPLAAFYLSEARSHLHWAMRVKPVRKLSTGQDLDVKSLLDALDKTVFKSLADVVAAKDSEKFPTQYQATMAACYSCHVAAEKPYLKLKIPAEPAEQMIDFTPSNP